MYELRVVRLEEGVFLGNPPPAKMTVKSERIGRTSPKGSSGMRWKRRKKG